MKEIKIVVDGPTARDVKLVELDGKDITTMLTRIDYTVDAGSINRIYMELIGNVHLEIHHPLGIKVLEQ